MQAAAVPTNVPPMMQPTIRQTMQPTMHASLSPPHTHTAHMPPSAARIELDGLAPSVKRQKTMTAGVVTAGVLAAHQIDQMAPAKPPDGTAPVQPGSATTAAAALAQRPAPAESTGPAGPTPPAGVGAWQCVLPAVPSQPFVRRVSTDSCGVWTGRRRSRRHTRRRHTPAYDPDLRAWCTAAAVGRGEYGEGGGKEGGRRELSMRSVWAGRYTNNASAFACSLRAPARARARARARGRAAAGRRPPAVGPAAGP